jgi:hypothetical protein
LVLEDKIDAICSGTIISEEFVLTAGHCVKGVSPKVKMEAIVGFYSSSQEDEKKVRTEPLWSRARKKDELVKLFFNQIIRITVKDIVLSTDKKLALLKLSRKIVFSEKVSNICLPLATGIVDIQSWRNIILNPLNLEQEMKVDEENAFLLVQAKISKVIWLKH